LLAWLEMRSVRAEDVRVIEPTQPIDVAEITRIFRAAPHSLAARTRSIRKVAADEQAGPSGVALRIPFALDSATIPVEGREQLDAIAAGLRAVAGAAQVSIEGHADARGSDRYNEALSWRRAQAVRDYLVSRGVTGSGLKTRGLGRSAPLNKGEPFAPENRRVEFKRMP
jgi:outer membrane protein OmpA-like peptidoglycan-associated protein